MQHKLIMTWDITEGKEQEYFDLLVHTFVPRMNQLGFELTDAWATIYGDCPQVLVTAILPDMTETPLYRNADVPERLERFDRSAGRIC